MGPSTPGSAGGGRGFSAVTPGSAGSSAWSGGRPASALGAGSGVDDLGGGGGGGGGDDGDDDDGDPVTEDGRGGGGDEDEGDEQEDAGGEDDFGEEALKAKRLEYPAAKVIACVRLTHRQTEAGGGFCSLASMFLHSRSCCSRRMLPGVGMGRQAARDFFEKDRLTHLLP